MKIIGTKTHTPYEWAEFFGFEFMDIDGWSPKTPFSKPIGIEEFVIRACACCIRPFDRNKYKLFNFFC